MKLDLVSQHFSVGRRDKYLQESEKNVRNQNAWFSAKEAARLKSYALRKPKSSKNIKHLGTVVIDGRKNVTQKSEVGKE